MEINGPDVNSGMMWVRRAFWDSAGRGKRPVWVEAMWLPFGSRTWMGFAAGLISVREELVGKKCPLAPLSAVALR